MSANIPPDVAKAALTKYVLVGANTGGGLSIGTPQIFTTLHDARTFANTQEYCWQVIPCNVKQHFMFHCGSDYVTSYLQSVLGKDVEIINMGRSGAGGSMNPY